jgi:hypothetical protein
MMPRQPIPNDPFALSKIVMDSALANLGEDRETFGGHRLWHFARSWGSAHPHYGVGPAAIWARCVSVSAPTSGR